MKQIFQKVMPFKFQVQKQFNELCRLGLITDIDSIEEKIETPMTLLFFKNGAVPFLTPDNYENIKYLPKIIQCPLNYVTDNFNVLKQFGKGLSTFIGKKDSPVIITQSDPSQEDTEVGLTRNSFSVWCIGGKTEVTLDNYFQMIKSCKPFLWQAPCDNETSIDSPSAKRLQKGVERTINFLSVTNKELEKQVIPGDCIVSFTGGINWLRRRQCLERMLTAESKAIIIDGFHGIIPTTGVISDECIELINKMSIKIREIDNSKLILLQKFHQPSQVVKCVNVGIDIFDGAFPYLLTMSRIAWIYSTYKSKANGEGEAKSQWLNIADDCYIESFDVALDPRCECFACRNHTKGYINHLIKTNELLANILLMIHNSTQYYLFFHEMRSAISNETFDLFHDWALDITCPEEYLVGSKDMLT